MTVLMFPPVVPNAVYRIRSAARSNPDQYLEWTTENEVRPAELKADSNTQKWKIEGNQDDTYTIVNVASNAGLCVKSYEEGGQKKQKLFAGGQDQYWTLEPRGDDFVIGVVQNATCVDLADNGWVILWERNNLPHQRWILDSVEVMDFGDNGFGGNTSNTNTNTGNTNTGNTNTHTGTNTANPGNNTNTNTTNTGNTGSTIPQSSGSAPTIGAGLYNIKNRQTSSEIVVWTGHQKEYAPVLVWPSTGSRNYNSRAWAVNASGDGVTITNSYNKKLGNRCLREGPFVNPATNVCRLIPVPGTQYYHIATGTGSNSRVVMDQNPPRAANKPATMSDYNKDDQRQHWEFNPAH